MAAFSLDLVIDEIHGIFGERKHSISVPIAAEPYVTVSYEGEIGLVKKRKIAELFPDRFYIYFYPNTEREDADPDQIELPEANTDMVSTDTEKVKIKRIHFPRGKEIEGSGELVHSTDKKSVTFPGA